MTMPLETADLQRTEPQTLIAWMRERRSIRRYRAEPLPRELIERLIDAARFAPSAHNRQPWRFAVVQEAERKETLAAAMGARLHADHLADGDDPELIAQDIARSHARITTAPAIIAACTTFADMDVYPDARRAEAEWLMAVQSTAMAVQNLLLLAHAQGLGACWMCAPLFCPDTVKGVLQLPADWQPQALITLGHPATPGHHRERRGIAEIVQP